jgi:hypothetical protein
MTAGAPCQYRGRTQRVVYLMRENDSNQAQVWRIDRYPVEKVMAMATKRSHETAQL